MTEKTVTARKEYKCAFCGRVIKKGQKHQFGKTRGPKLADDFETQIGIEYAQWRLCLEGDADCKEPPENYPVNQ